MGGGGDFRAPGIFFRHQIPCKNFFRPEHEYFLGLISVHEFFFRLIIPCANMFFVLRPGPPSPHKFSNAPFLTYRKASLILSVLKFGERFEVVTLVEQIHYGLVSQKSR